jgi:hypothetical protein
VVSTRLFAHEALRLRRIAERNGLTQCQLVAEMLRSLLDASPVKPDRGEARLPEQW